MNGDNADAPENAIRNPKSNNTNSIGSSQNFLRTFKNPHRSRSRSIGYSCYVNTDFLNHQPGTDDFE